MGLFKGMKDMAKLTKQANELQDQQQEQAGYKPGLGGSMAQMGDMLSDATEQMAELTDQSGDQSRLLTEGIAAQGVIVGMGTPARGATTFNLDIDLEVHVPGRAPYRVANQYMVPERSPDRPRRDAAGPGRRRRPVQGRDRLEPGGQRIRSAARSARRVPTLRPRLRRPPRLRVRRQLGWTRSPSSSASRSCSDSGALTDAEFEQQKARILGG